MDIRRFPPGIDICLDCWTTSVKSCLKYKCTLGVILVHALKLYMRGPSWPFSTYLAGKLMYLCALSPIEFVKRAWIPPIQFGIYT